MPLDWQKIDLPDGHVEYKAGPWTVYANYTRSRWMVKHGAGLFTDSETPAGLLLTDSGYGEAVRWWRDPQHAMDHVAFIVAGKYPFLVKRVDGGGLAIRTEKA